MQAETRPDINLEGYFEQFRIQAQNHPGGESMRALYGVLASQAGDERLQHFIGDIVSKRLDINPSHFSNLLARAIQYNLYIKRHNRDYPEYGQEQWSDFLQTMVNQQSEQSHEVRKILETRRTNTTIPERYCGPRFILYSIYGEQGINIADFASSIALGVRELELGICECQPVDMTPDRLSERLRNAIPNIIGGLASDIDDLEDEMEWVAACTVYFKDIDHLGALLLRNRSAKRDSKIVFHQADMLDPNLVIDPHDRASGFHIKKGSYNSGMVLTALFQLSDAGTATALDNIRRATKPGGVVIVQDFFGLEYPSKVDPVSSSIPLTDLGMRDERHLVRFQDFYAGDTYRTLVFTLNKEQEFDRAYDVLRWNHARCEVMYPGADYNSFLEWACKGVEI